MPGLALTRNSGEWWRLVVRRQLVPYCRVFLTQHPRAETLQAVFFDQCEAVAEGARIGVENPFSRLITIKIKP